MIVGFRTLAGKKIQLEEPSVKFWLLTLPQMKVRRLAMLKTSLRRRRRRRKRRRRKRRRRKRRRKRRRRRRGTTTTTKAAASLSRSRHNKHWPAKSSTQLRCSLCSSRSQRKGTQCARCDVGLCLEPCFT
jgi:hypothetical protein